MKITIIRTDDPMLDDGLLETVRRFLFGLFNGWSAADARGWAKFWKFAKRLEPGEFVELEVIMPRSGKFHRRHMKIEGDIFAHQDKFTDFEIFRDWLKVGAGWVVWCAGPKGGVVPIPKSISYAKADQAEFEQFHAQVVEFLRGDHAAPYLWKHLGDKAHDMMDSILNEFNE